MATNFYFNNFQNSQEQYLIESLIVESIKIYGQDMFYLPRTLVNRDNLYEESTVVKFDSAIPLEFYIKNVEGFAGQGDFLSKFNVEIRDQVTLTVSRKSFADEVSAASNLMRPMEGDLIYFPLNRKLFVIKFVEHEAIFYQMGSLQIYDLNCELFEYTSEVFNTGIEDIDLRFRNYSHDAYFYSIKTEDGSYIMQEDPDGMDAPLVIEAYNVVDKTELDDNEEIQIESDDIIDFSERDPFSEGGVY